MANYQRSDPSSVSFGRRLQQTENQVRHQSQAIETLQQGQLSSREKQTAKELASDRDAERMRAKQLLASYSASTEDLQSLNQALLTPALREQVRLNITALYSAQAPTAIQFDEAALARINNFRQFTKENPRDVFQQNNDPFTPPVNTGYQRWLKNQQTPATQRLNAQRQRAEQESSLLKAKQVSNQKVQKPSGIDFLNPNAPR